MATRLRLVFRELRSASALKALVFGALLASAGNREQQALPAFVFAGGAVLLYLFPLFRTARLFPSFAVLTAGSALASIRFGDTPLHAPLVILAACSCYLLLRLKDLTFVFRARWHHLFVLTTSYLVFVAALPPLAGRFGIFRFAGIFVALAVLMAQLFGEQGDTLGSRRHRKVLALAASLVVLEVLWATTVLPVGILNAASIGLITLFTATGFILRYRAGDLTRQSVMRSTFVLMVLIAALLIATRWSFH